MYKFNRFCKNLTFFCFFISQIIFAQKEANNWYFGHHAGITFNGDALVALTDASTSFNAWGGTGSISDKDRNLLFYTDGAYVFDRTHQVIQIGSGMLGKPNIRQSNLIFSHPGNYDLYYIFTISNRRFFKI